MYVFSLKVWCILKSYTSRERFIFTINTFNTILKMKKVIINLIPSPGLFLTTIKFNAPFPRLRWNPPGENLSPTDFKAYLFINASDAGSVTEG